jgi:hypothetical protein
VDLHADEAAINVNLWVTPTDANLDPSGGGLVVYKVRDTRLTEDSVRYG